MSTKVCIDCRKAKGVGEFYLRSDGRNYTSVCKECMKKRSAINSKAQRSKFISTVDSENALLNALHQQGIPAWPGKAMSHTFADVIAWGIVKIEVKYAAPDERGRFKWHFTPSQVKAGVRGHITVLALENRYSVLRSDDPLFYHPDGERKSGFVYPNSRSGLAFVNQAIEAGINHWSIVQTVRDELCQQLREGRYDVNARI